MITPHAIVDNFLALLEGKPANPTAGKPRVRGLVEEIVPALKMLAGTFNIDVQPLVKRIRVAVHALLDKLAEAYPEPKQ